MDSHRKGFISTIIIICLIIVCSTVSALQAGTLAESPYLKYIIINSDTLAVTAEGFGRQYVQSDKTLTLPYTKNNILFELNPGIYSRFQFFLEGYDKEWTAWRKGDFKEYTNLPAGTYKLMLRYRGSNTEALETDLIEFSILPPWYLSLPALILFPLLLLLCIWWVYNRISMRFAKTRYMLEQIINSGNEELKKEKEKSETLLKNVMPKATAGEVLNTGKAGKTKYNFVTVLFSDIQGFTRIAEEMNPEVLIDELDKFFFHFDTVVEKYDIEKIKTIGDAYMCAGGIPEKNRTNPVEVVLAALEMQEYMLQMKGTTDKEGVKFWDIRIGIHTGTVIAGVVGHKKMTYDIWGDTVNTASRMETSGEAGKVNISGTTYEFVKDFFICEHRGKMPVKYKGELDMYFVEGIKPELSDEANKPNKKFYIRMQLMKIQDIEDQVFKLFDDEASPDLFFHNSAMAKSICTQVELLARAENLPDEEFIILKLASIFLLTGYISDFDSPVAASCENASEMLPKFGFGINDINETRVLITSSFTGAPESNVEKILYDARFDYLGRVDYVRQTERLLKEQLAYGKVKDLREWLEKQKRVLEDHEFNTRAAKILCGVTKEEQIKNLETLTGEILK